MKMTHKKKRELTERIAKWVGAELATDIPDWDDNSFRKEHMYYFPGELSPIPFYPLISRDDWSRVEEEIEKRGLWENYITVLGGLLGLIMDGCYISSFACGEFRRASPEECAQAWDEMMKEVGE